MFDFPNTPTNNQTTQNGGVVYRWDGVKWKVADTAAGGGGATITISDTPPASPQTGAMWWDSVGGQLYLYYTDQDTSQWVIANSAPIATDAPNDLRTYARRSGAWSDISSAIAASANNIGRNYIHNGSFAIAQRGNGPFTVNAAYSFDRWVTNATLDTISWTRVALTDADRSAIGDESATWCAQNVFTGNSGATAVNNFVQRIEDLRRLANRTVTLSFWARTTSGTLKIGQNAGQNFGTGGSPSTNLNMLATGNVVTINTTWTRYSTTWQYLSLAGKTLGTNNDHNSTIHFWFSSGANQNAASGNIGVQSGTVQIYGVMLEVGSGMGFPTPYIQRDPVDELALCQRFYYSTVLCYSSAYQQAGAVANAIAFLPVPLRSMTVTFNVYNDYSSNSASRTLTVFNYYTIYCNATATAATGTVINVQFSVSADL